jgi:acetyltransferase-like isoleucine patch superfamily enzyme
MENINELHLVGYGGLGKEIEFLIQSKFPKIKIIPYDDYSQQKGVNKIEKLKEISVPVDCIIAIGDPYDREKVYNTICNNKFIKFPNIILSNFENYNYSKNNTIGKGNLIMPQSIIGFNSRVGDFNLFGVNSGIGHDVNIGNFNFFGPSCFLAGNVRVENNCKFSFGTFVLQKVSITSSINTMPYTTIYKNIKTPGTYYGNPSKKI